MFGKDLGDPEGDGGVDVVAAGVHDPGVARTVGFCVEFGDGEGVHVRADPDAGAAFARGALEQGHDAVPRDARLGLDPQFLKPLRDEGRGFLLLVGELGIRVEVPARLHQLREKRVDGALEECVAVRGGRGRAKEEKGGSNEGTEWSHAGEDRKAPRPWQGKMRRSLARVINCPYLPSPAHRHSRLNARSASPDRSMRAMAASRVTVGKHSRNSSRV